MSEPPKIADPAAERGIDLTCMVNGAGTELTIVVSNLPEGVGFTLGDSLSPVVSAGLKAYFGNRVIRSEGGAVPVSKQ